ncbi:MAG: 16S rRNA (uracil(1498)-N(3))-methyltransferase [Legionellales bacterium RIFCSPHIGHO2_12_FULL_37_14]|nr:MAG: 16S rRNA (uracil(1498)-N(3))-methyltransferase [Legionellales bacterium RIFCSPHIGHO2_12_FULL_37_14]
MRKTRIYQQGDFKVKDLVTLDNFAAHHLAVVLRARIKDEIYLFPGNGYEYLATIWEINKKTVIVHIDKELKKSLESPLAIHLGQAICKSDKMDWILQKATELGVCEFTPIIADRSQGFNAKMAEKKLKHWKNIIIHATEQSGRTILPKLNQPISLLSLVQKVQAKAKLLLTQDAELTFKTIPRLDKDISFLVGPEGGWSNDELRISTEQGFKKVKLGPRILRTETAPLASLAILQFMAGDL